MFKQWSSGWERGAGGVVEVQGGDEGSESFFFFRGGWEGFWGGFGGKRLSGLKGQRVDLSMNKSVSVYFFFFPSRGGTVSKQL